MSSNFPSTWYEAQDRILQQAIVTPQMVTDAKGIILDQINGVVSSAQLIDLVLSQQKVPSPVDELSLHKSWDSTADIQAIALRMAWTVASAEAILSLVYGCILLRIDGTDYVPRFRGKRFEGHPGSGGSRADFNFDDFGFPVPAKVRLAASFKKTPADATGSPAT
jgi:hypothetical protein